MYDPIDLLTITVHRERNHIGIKSEKQCTTCTSKICTLICPTEVYYWKDRLDIKYWRCLECGACEIVCSNIDWNYPLPPYGVSYREN